jgi:hypothetical protein
MLKLFFFYVSSFPFNFFIIVKLSCAIVFGAGELYYIFSKSPGYNTVFIGGGIFCIKNTCKILDLFRFRKVSKNVIIFFCSKKFYAKDIFTTRIPLFELTLKWAYSLGDTNKSFTLVILLRIYILTKFPNSWCHCIKYFIVNM